MQTPSRLYIHTHTGPARFKLLDTPVLIQDAPPDVTCLFWLSLEAVDILATTKIFSSWSLFGRKRYGMFRDRGPFRAGPFPSEEGTLQRLT